MTESLDEMEARVRAALAKAKTGPKATRRLAVTAPTTPTKRAANEHAKLMLIASKSRLEYVYEAMRSMTGDDATVTDEDFVTALKDMVAAFDGLLSASESIVKDLKRERDELRDQLGDQEAGKKAQRREAAGVVGSGAVSIGAMAGDWLRASVKDGSATHRIERHGKRWSCSCSCSTAGDCKHVRAVQLVTFKTAAEPVAPDADAKTLAASGAVWIRSYDERELGLAEVVEGGNVHVLAKTGFGGFSCDCGSMNGRCVHGDAVRVVVGQ